MCVKVVKTVKYYTKSLSHSSLPSPYSLDTVLSPTKKKKVSLPQTKSQIQSLRSTPRCHSSPAIDPLIGAIHHRPPIHSSAPLITDCISTAIGAIHYRSNHHRSTEFFFFFFLSVILHRRRPHCFLATSTIVDSFF